MDIKEILDYELVTLGEYVITTANIFYLALVYVITRVLLWVIRKTLLKGKLFSSLEHGQALAYYQICKYLVIVIAISLGLESMGIKITILLAGSAALLVGVGLGLQQLFNDLVSGFIILTEQTIKIDDIIEVENIVARVQEIGLRTSKIETRNGIIMIVPNSKIVNEMVTNWSHTTKDTRFSLVVGVAYGSDVRLVARLLKEAAQEHQDTDNHRETIARFTDFGDSALTFELLFWSQNKFRIEDVKSDIRYAINDKFIANGVEIPFPQRDLHIRSAVPIPTDSSKE